MAKNIVHQFTQAANHPKKGQALIIEPIRSLDDVARVKHVLRDRPRDLALFTMGVNVNLRGCDLLSLTWNQIDFDNRQLIMLEKKTGKKRFISLNNAVISALLATPRCGDLLFPSAATGEMLGVNSLNAMMKLWCFRAGLKGNFGAHTMRKTWAYIQYKVFGVDLALISQELNHSSMKTTYRYLGIMPDEVKAVYANEI